MSHFRQLAQLAACLTLLSVLAPPVVSQEVRLAEDFSPGHQYQTTATLTIQGRLALPSQEKGKAPQVIDMTGRSTLRYDELVLPPLDSGTIRTVRAFREVDMHRVQGPNVSDHGLRPSVRRCVFLWGGVHKKMCFSPDGPLTWDETDLLRTDVFNPVTIPGILPKVPVRPEQSWRVAPEAIAEIVDIEKVEAGELTVKFVALTVVNDRRTARLSISGTVRGVNEDGPTRQTFDGSTAYFDLDSRVLSYLSLRATKEMLDGRGQVVGRTEGQFTLTRSVGALPSDLTEDALRGLELKPTVENTLLLYDNASLGVRFLHPRSWRVGAEQGKQVTLDHPRAGGGILITVDAAAKIPTADDYMKEIGEYLKQVKARNIRLAEAATRLRSDPPLDRFALDAEMSDARCRMIYAVLKQSEGGATVAIRLPAEVTLAMSPEVERILRSIAITRTIEGK